MGSTVKKFMHFDYLRIPEMEEKLEQWATEGLILHKVGNRMWTFKKDEPKNIKYCISFFEKGSRFNPENDEEESLYREHAKEYGWDFVDSYDVVQVFSSEDENVMPFETDEWAKFESIKKSMNKSFVKPTLIATPIWIFNFILQYCIYRSNPMEYLSETGMPSLMIIFMLTTITNIYTLTNYYIYINKYKKCLESENKMISRPNKIKKIVENIISVITIILCIDITLGIINVNNPKLLILVISQYPIMYFAFKFINKKLSKSNKSNKVNKTITALVMFVISIVYMGILSRILIEGDFFTENSKAKYSVEYELYEDEYINQQIYKDDIPIKCEDIYDIDYYKDYSYKKNLEDTMLYSSEVYIQEPLYKDDEYPRLSYKVIEPKFDFVYNRIVKDQLNISDEFLTIEKIDNNIFDTIEAYIYKYHRDDEYYNGYIGEYLLLYEDKIISIDISKKISEDKIDILRQKLLQL